MSEGWERFVDDSRKAINLDEQYKPYPMQAAYHSSSAPYRFLGGAAGPGKTTALLMENLISCNEFSPVDGPQVHTLMLRRTQPQVRNTLLTRFREKIPRELYKSLNETTLTCTWLNNATTQFGSMQYEHDVFAWQGQWKDVYYDELCEFTWPQWSNIAPWNRCPVSRNVRRMGAGNPIGVGTSWVRPVFVDHRPYDGMDARQRSEYRASDYAYFPCTYLDNPIFANDPQFIAGLMALPEPLRKALMEGSWDVTGGYFTGAFDSAENVIPADEWNPKPWHRQWISGDWGFEHFTALYRHYMDDFGVIRTGHELMLQHHSPEMLGESIVNWLRDSSGRFPQIVSFPFSHDAFADQTTKSYGANPLDVAHRMAKPLRDAGIPTPINSGKDKVGREQAMYDLLRKRVPSGLKDDSGAALMCRNWLISDDCPKLIECLIAAPRDEKKVEQIAPFLGDDPLQGAGYGVYHILGRPAAKPAAQLLHETVQKAMDEGKPMEAHFIQWRETMKLQNAGGSKQWWD